MTAKKKNIKTPNDIPRYRTFDGKRFVIATDFIYTKAIADETATHYRNRGFLARVVKFGKGWITYRYFPPEKLKSNPRTITVSKKQFEREMGKEMMDLFR